eukprot:gene31270-38636_t
MPYASWFFLGIEIIPVTSGDMIQANKVIPRAIQALIVVIIVSGLSVIFCASSIAPGGVSHAFQTSYSPLSYGYSLLMDIPYRHAIVFTILAKYITAFSFMYGFGRQISAMHQSGLIMTFLSDFAETEDSIRRGLFLGTALSVVGLTVTWVVDNGLFKYYHSACVLGNYLLCVGIFCSYIRFKSKFSALAKTNLSPFGITGACYGIAVFLVAIISLLGFQGDHGIVVGCLAVLVVYMAARYWIWNSGKPTISSEEQSVLFVLYVINANATRKKLIHDQAMARIHHDSSFHGDFGLHALGDKIARGTQPLRNSVASIGSYLTSPHGGFSRQYSFDSRDPAEEAETPPSRKVFSGRRVSNLMQNNKKSMKVGAINVDTSGVSPRSVGDFSINNADAGSVVSADNRFGGDDSSLADDCDSVVPYDGPLVTPTSSTVNTTNTGITVNNNSAANKFLRLTQSDRVSSRPNFLIPTRIETTKHQSPAVEVVEDVQGDESDSLIPLTAEQLEVREKDKKVSPTMRMLRDTYATVEALVTSSPTHHKLVKKDSDQIGLLPMRKGVAERTLSKLSESPKFSASEQIHKTSRNNSDMDKTIEDFAAEERVRVSKVGMLLSQPSDIFALPQESGLESITMSASESFKRPPRGGVQLTSLVAKLTSVDETDLANQVVGEKEDSFRRKPQPKLQLEPPKSLLPPSNATKGLSHSALDDEDSSGSDSSPNSKARTSPIPLLNSKPRPVIHGEPHGSSLKAPQSLTMSTKSGSGMGPSARFKLHAQRSGRFKTPFIAKVFSAGIKGNRYDKTNEKGMDASILEKYRDELEEYYANEEGGGLLGV